MSKTKRAVRTNLDDSEWGKLKSAAALAGKTIEVWTSDLIRAVLKGAKL